MSHLTYPNRKQSLLLVFLFLLSFAFYFFFTLTVPQLFGFSLPKLWVEIVYSIASPICTLPLILYVSQKSGIPIKWSIRLPKIHFIVLLIILALSVKIISSPLLNPKELISNLVNGKIRIEVFYIKEFNWNIIIKFVGIVVIAPIFEEIFWRKQVLGLLLKRYTPTLSLILSSVLFAIFHLRLSDIGSLIIWGLLFGLIYYQTKHIEMSILLHSFSNCTIFFINQKYIAKTDFEIIKNVSILFVCAIIILLIIMYLKRYGSSDRPKNDFSNSV